jgi:uncharacterized membrane-anchored protein YhcB (DUF1043 family)
METIGYIAAGLLIGFIAGVVLTLIFKKKAQEELQGTLTKAQSDLTNAKINLNGKG